ncbi:MAG: hypothetical protein JO075_04420 [Acidimicrobiia bacterium]|nr:hypothetical protein [Acidimicrobiia bacterium]
MPRLPDEIVLTKAEAIDVLSAIEETLDALQGARPLGVAMVLAPAAELLREKLTRGD